MIAVRKFLRDRGVSLYSHWHPSVILPPLIIPPEQLAEGFEVLDQALKIADEAVVDE